MREKATGGLTVIALEMDGELLTDPQASTELVPGCTLLTIGSEAQLEAFRATFS